MVMSIISLTPQNNLTEDYLNDLLELEAGDGIFLETIHISAKDDEIGDGNNQLSGGEEEGLEETNIVEEITDKDRLQQKQGTSNILNHPAFVKHMQVSAFF